MLRLVTILTATMALNAQAGDCEVEQKIDESMNLDGIDMLSVAAAAGDLKITGRAGIREARVRATICASSQELARDTEVHLEPGRVSVKTPDWEGGLFSGRQYARVDLEIEVPEDLDLDVRDSSGDIGIENVASVSLKDSSGNIEITDVAGSLTIEDSSGDIDVTDVEGDLVILSDSSGSIHGRDITGSVRVAHDSSGDMRFKDVGGDVEIERDSSGNIQVAGVGGDFRVLRDGSGSIRHTEVSGTVDIPRDD
jgi:DUF4097 and DUF4098 domain-containing protein YvlB